MNIIKKIFTLILLFVFVLNISPVSAKSSNMGPLYKEVILAKKELKSSKSGEKYAKQIEQIVKSLKNDKEKLEKLKRKTDILVAKLKNDNSVKNRKTKQIINYLNAEVTLALVILAKSEETKVVDIIDDFDKIEEKITNNYDEKIKEMLTSTLSKSDEEKVNAELVKIQLNLLENGTKNLKDLTEEFEKLTNYEQKGSFNMNFNFDQENIGKIDANIKLEDLTAKASNFDSQMKGKIEAVINSAILGKEEFKFELSSFIDFISKDGNIYFLLEDLEVSEDKIDEIKTYVEKIQEAAKNGKYIKYDDKASPQAIAFLKSLNPNNILEEGNVILNQPMFKAYKKVDDKYYLTPTKYACDKTKELLNKFDPFNGKTCSEGQYEDMLENLAEVGDIYIILGDENTLGFEGITNTQIEKLEGSITFSDNSVEKINIEISPNQEFSPNEGLTIEYIKNNKLSASLYADKGEIDYYFDSTLDRDNKFTYIDFSGSSKSSYSDFESKLKLENNQIDGTVNLKTSRYDYNTRQYLDDNVLSGKITGNTDRSNEIENLKIEYQGVDKNAIEYLTGRFEYSEGKISLVNNFETNGTKADLEISGEWDNINNILTSGNFDLNVSTKERTWDEETFEIVYKGDFKEIFSSNISLDNGAINGSTNITSNGTKILSITHNGNYEKNYFKLNNNFEFDSEINPFLIYSNQIKIARDSIRISDLKALQGAIEQVYQDSGEYPTKENFEETVKSYLGTIPKDPSGNIEMDGCKFGYIYEVGDNNGISNQKYKLSTCFENNGNIERKAKNDGGIDNNRLEIGLNLNSIDFNEKFYINGTSSWTKIEEEKDEISGNINFEFDMKDNNSNSNIYFDVDLNDKKVIKFEMDSKATIEYKDVEIEMPDEDNIIDIYELFDIEPVNNNFYY